MFGDFFVYYFCSCSFDFIQQWIYWREQFLFCFCFVYFLGFVVFLISLCFFLCFCFVLICICFVSVSILIWFCLFFFVLPFNFFWLNVCLHLFCISFSHPDFVVWFYLFVYTVLYYLMVDIFFVYTILFSWKQIIWSNFAYRSVREFDQILIKYLNLETFWGSADTNVMIFNWLLSYRVSLED